MVAGPKLSTYVMVCKLLISGKGTEDIDVPYPFAYSFSSLK